MAFLSSISNILLIILGFGVLIFVHELGHFLMARRIGVRVLTFSLGFGPKLLSFKRGDTDIQVAAAGAPCAKVEEVKDANGYCAVRALNIG